MQMLKLAGWVLLGTFVGAFLQGFVSKNPDSTTPA